MLKTSWLPRAHFFHETFNFVLLLMRLITVQAQDVGVSATPPLAYSVLTAFRSSIENWPEYSKSNGLLGWNSSIPPCLWTGVVCHENATIQSISLPCRACPVKAIGQLSANLSLLPYMDTINLQYNSFYGGFPPQWLQQGAFPLLNSLFLEGNNLTGALPDLDPGAMPFLRQLTLSDNHFEGMLPESWGRTDVFKNLGVLRLKDNNISGAIPKSYFASGLPKLETLDLSNNKITGSLPPIPGNNSLPLLRELRLQGNNFTGGVPLEYGEAGVLPSLRVMDLSMNPLGGELPNEWGKPNSFPVLRQLNLSWMGLSGPLPPAWPVGFPQLDALQLEGNNLTGPIPSTNVGFKSLKRLTVKPGNPGLCGPPPSGLPFQLCDARDLSCSLLPVNLDPCPPSTPPLTSTAYGSDGGANPFGSPLATSTNTSTSDEGGSSSVGAIVGGVVGGVAALAALLLIIGLLVKRRRDAQRHAAKLAQEEPPENPFIPLEEGNYGGVALWNGGGVNMQRALSNTTSNESDGGGILPRGWASRFSLLRTPTTTGGSTPLPSTTKQYSPPSQGTTIAMQPSADFPVQQGAEFPWSDWHIDPSEIQIVKRRDGSDWELGSGSFGRVYKGLRNGVQLVAVKIIKVMADERLTAYQDTQKEVAILKSCRDANIVQFQGAYLGEEETMLITEYCEGGDLLHNVEAGRVTWYRRGHRIALDIAKGLVFLHSRRIVHFDLKSPNILLARDGTAKIADVGMAKLLQRDYVTGVVASLAWSAPEMLWGARCSEKVDIYSYGIVLWEICTGEMPERGRLRDIRVPEECTEQVRQLILECLDSRPSKRPSALQIVERLRAMPLLTAPPYNTFPATDTAATTPLSSRSDGSSSHEATTTGSTSHGIPTTPTISDSQQQETSQRKTPVDENVEEESPFAHLEQQERNDDVSGGSTI